MKALYFAGDDASTTVNLYNRWAKGKPLTRDVIMHTLIVQPNNNYVGGLLIIVYFDETLHPQWVGDMGTVEKSL